MLYRTQQLANSIKPFIFELTTVSYLNEFFRCLFIKVDKTKEIMEANQKARSIFDREQEPIFSPHLSLMYGNFPSVMKEEIINKIGGDFHIRFEAKSIYLVLSSSNVEPKNWKRLRQFML
jgi:2'-5' RNA ligase